MKSIKRFLWKLEYARTIRREVGMTIIEGFRFASNAIADDPHVVDEMDGDEAASEELSYWHD